VCPHVKLYTETSELFLHDEVQLVFSAKRLPRSASFSGPETLKSDDAKSGLRGGRKEQGADFCGEEMSSVFWDS